MTEATETKGELPPKPSDRLIIQYGPEDSRQERVLFFSFLRQNSLCRVLESPADVVGMKINPDLSETVLRIMLAEKGGAGQMASIELDETLIGAEDVERILDWVQDHMTHFFMKRFQEMAEKAKLLEPVATSLKQSATGSPD